MSDNRPHGNARSPYVRRDSAQIRIGEIDRDIEQMIDIKRKLMARLRQLDVECEQAETQRSEAPEAAPNREVNHVGEI
jgi:flagellar biosynthesis/type III secretory pathway chaperone